MHDAAMVRAQPGAMRVPWRTDLLAFLLLCSLGTLSEGWRSLNWGDALSAVDAYSEANAIRGARNFVDRGLTISHGLPMVFHRGLYPTEGFAGETKTPIPGVTEDGVYTHYPPGPEYILAAAITAVGTAPVAVYRAVPLALCWAATVFLGVSIRRRFGTAVAWLVMAACAGVPSFSDANSFLHYDGYAQALLLTQIALLLRGGPFLIALGAAGFAQGWLSFDYAFLVAGSPLALELALSRLGAGSGAGSGWRIALAQSVAAGAGFTLAHGLHLAQIAAHLGGFGAALADLTGAAAHRSGALQIDGLFDYLATVNIVLASYFIGSEPVRLSAGDMTMFRFLGIVPGLWWLAASAAIAVLARHRLTDWMLVSLSAMGVSSLWYIAMVNHAIVHHHFLYRHLLFGFLVCVLFLAALPGASRRQ